MQKFVELIAQTLIESKTPLQDWIVVLPSERAKQYVQKALFEQVNKPIFAPKIVTINNWINSLSEKVVLDKTRLLLILFEIHQNYPANDIEKTFDEFLNWGTILLSDFDEIERYLVDSNQLFRNLKDVKEIENWSFNSEELTESQQKYLAFWERLPHYFKELKIILQKQNACIQGEVYNKIASEINLVFKENKNTHFLFAGFNALSLAEMTIFRQIHRLGRAEILFDTDGFYMEDKNHEAGQFIRKFAEFLAEKDLIKSNSILSTSSKKIELISCSQATGQVKVASTILAQKSEEELNQTLILLADESLIIPLLQNIPKTVIKANITIGLPLKSSALITWVDLIFNIQEGIQRYKRVTVYYKDLFSIWNHPFINEILNPEEQKILYQREKIIRAKNIVFQSPEKVIISDKLDLILRLLYTPWENSYAKAIEIIRQLNQILFNEFKINDINKLEKAIVQRFDEVIIDFQNCVLEGFPEMSLRSFKTLFSKNGQVKVSLITEIQLKVYKSWDF